MSKNKPNTPAPVSIWKPEHYTLYMDISLGLYAYIGEGPKNKYIHTHNTEGIWDLTHPQVKAIFENAEFTRASIGTIIENDSKRFFSIK